MEPDREPPPDDPPGEHPRHHPFRDASETLAEAATEAELLTGHREETVAQARAGVVRRVARSFGGFVVIGVGIALLPLPGPGWLVIVVGLAMLPFAWAERTIVQIRRRIPGIPEEGRVPTTTWVVMALMVLAFTTVSILFGRQVGDWFSQIWDGLWD